ncbi:MAG: YtrH family sporulation protein [Bacillota bacterium]
MNRIIPAFFIALGVIMGGSFLASIGGILINQPPLKIMSDSAADLKLYAIISAIGGTFANIRLLEGSFFQGEIITIIQQFLIFFSAYLGAQLGYWLITVLCGGK